jgi:hypothetical protein
MVLNGYSAANSSVAKSRRIAPPALDRGAFQVIPERFLFAGSGADIDEVTVGPRPLLDVSPGFGDCRRYDP